LQSFQALPFSTSAGFGDCVSQVGAGGVVLAIQPSWWMARLPNRVRRRDGASRLAASKVQAMLTPSIGHCAIRGLRALGPIHHGPSQGQAENGSKSSAAGTRGARQFSAPNGAGAKAPSAFGAELIEVQEAQPPGG